MTAEEERVLRRFGVWNEPEAYSDLSIIYKSRKTNNQLNIRRVFEETILVSTNEIPEMRVSIIVTAFFSYILKRLCKYNRLLLKTVAVATLLFIKHW